MTMLKTIVMAAIVLMATASISAGEYTYTKITELRINSDKDIYVEVEGAVQENNCANSDHYILASWNGAYEQIYKALLTAYVSGATVSFKNTDGCDVDTGQPLINFMRLK